MAIMLDIQVYCEECDGFSPKVNKTEIVSLDGNDKHDTMIFCEYKKRCSRMYQQAKRFVEKEYEVKNNG